MGVKPQKPPRALTVAGSDSGGGAGMQADLKTFAALGVYGTSVITAVTAQNTRGVTAIQTVDPGIVRAQIRAVFDDIGVDSAKTGMLHNGEVIGVVAEELKRYGGLVVVDPVMISKSGVELLRKDAVKALKDELIPVATVVTPNITEAERLSGLKIEGLGDVKRAARLIGGLGAKAVVVKGGHMPVDGRAVDTLYLEGEFQTFETEHIETLNTHGTGCVFSSAIAAWLAIGRSIPDAVREAKKFVTDAIRYAHPIGGGFGPVNPMAELYRRAEMYFVIRGVKEAVWMLEDHPEVAVLIPESQSNIGMALSLAEDPMDVAAIPGRVVKGERGVKASGCPAFGASSHVARMICVAMKHDPSIRAAMNIKYTEELVKLCEEMGLKVSLYDRRLEPPDVKAEEGKSTAWGVEEAVKKAGRVPDVIYHLGDHGKEPMMVIMGRSAVDVARLAVLLAKRYVEGLNSLNPL